MPDELLIETDLLIARALPAHDGYTWTLASRLGHMLRTAEDLFGERDQSYTILGVEFSVAGPQIWYPGRCRHIVIQLSPDCMSNAPRAFYQLGQECVHLLAPSDGRDANVIEEGLSVHFAERYLREELNLERSCSQASYLRARELVERLLAIDYSIVRVLRQTEPAMYRLTSENLVACNPSVPHDLAEKLTMRFTP